MRATGALTRIFGDISDTHNNDCGCTAAAIRSSFQSARGAPTSGTHKHQRQKEKVHFIFLFLAMKHPRWKSARFDIRNPEIIPRGPLVLDRLKQQLQLPEKHDLSTHGTPPQLPSWTPGGMHPASTFPIGFGLCRENLSRS